MSTQGVEISEFGVSIAELVQSMQDDKLLELLEDKLEGRSSTECQEIIAEVYEQLEAAVEDLKDIEEGLEEKEDEASEMDDEALEEKYEAEQDELDELMKQVRKYLPDALEAAYEEYALKNIESGDDISVSTVSYEDGDSVSVKATGGDVEVFEDEESDYDKNTDYDGDGFITARDYDAWKSEQQNKLFDGTYQNIFLLLDDQDVVQNVMYQNSSATVTVYNTQDNKTVTFEIEGLNKGVHVYFDFNNEGTISESVYKNWAEEFQKIAYFNDDANSLYERLHEESDEKRLEYIENYTDVVDSATFTQVFNAYTSGANETTVQEYTKAALGKLYGVLNTTDNTTSTEIWAEIINEDLAGLSDQTVSDVINCVVMSVVIKGGEVYFKQLFGGSIPAMIENAFVADGPLSTQEKVTSMILETQSGGTGLYSGEVFLDSVILPSEETAQYDVTHEDWGGSEGREDTIAAIEAYQEAVVQIDWAVDNGSAQTAIDALQEVQEEEEQGYSNTVTEEYLKAIQKGWSYLNNSGFTDDAGNLFDGITNNKYIELVGKGLSALTNYTSEIGIGDDISLMAQNLLDFLTAQNNEEDGDVAAGIIFILNDVTSPNGELVQALCQAHSGFADTIYTLLKSEGTPTDKVNDALGIIEKYR